MSPVVGVKTGGKKRGKEGGNVRKYEEKRAKPGFDTKVRGGIFEPLPPSYHYSPLMQIEDEEGL